MAEVTTLLLLISFDNSLASRKQLTWNVMQQNGVTWKTLKVETTRD